MSALADLRQLINALDEPQGETRSKALPPEVEHGQSDNESSASALGDGSGSSAKGPFYHGTKVDLKTGDLLTPGFNSNYDPTVVMNHIYFTALTNGAGLADTPESPLDGRIAGVSGKANSKHQASDQRVGRFASRRFIEAVQHLRQSQLPM